MIPPFVDAAWLRAHRDSVVLADVRFYLDGRNPRQAFESGHLPGAVYIDLEECLAEPPADAAGRHPLPSPERFARGLAAAGIGDEHPVVAYDDDGGVIAARLVWLLRVVGHPAALLDGGLSGSDEREAGPGPVLTPASFTARQWPLARLAEIDELARTSDVLIDARDPVRFAGGPDAVDPRSGHIPGARNLPARENVGPDGLLHPREQLRQSFREAGIEPGTQVISYCGSGVTACHNLLVLEHLGLGPGRLYPGSWSQWSRDPARQISTDPAS